MAEGGTLIVATHFAGVIGHNLRRRFLRPGQRYGEAVEDDYLGRLHRFGRHGVEVGRGDVLGELFSDGHDFSTSALKIFDSSIGR